MADYFTHFSCLLDVGTPKNAARALDLYNRLSEEGASEEPPSEGFLLSIQPEHGGTNLWMRDDVTGDPERLIQFVKLCAAESHSGAAGVFNTRTPARARASTALAAEPTCSISRPGKPSPGSTPTAGSPKCSMEAIPMPESTRAIARACEAWAAHILPVTTGLFFAGATPRHDAHGEGLFRLRQFAEWFGSGLERRIIHNATGAMREPGISDWEAR